MFDAGAVFNEEGKKKKKTVPGATLALGKR